MGLFEIEILYYDEQDINKVFAVCKQQNKYFFAVCKQQTLIFVV